MRVALLSGVVVAFRNKSLCGMDTRRSRNLLKSSPRDSLGRLLLLLLLLVLVLLLVLQVNVLKTKELYSFCSRDRSCCMKTRVEKTRKGVIYSSRCWFRRSMLLLLLLLLLRLLPRPLLARVCLLLLHLVFSKDAVLGKKMPERILRLPRGWRTPTLLLFSLLLLLFFPRLRSLHVGVPLVKECGQRPRLLDAFYHTCARRFRPVGRKEGAQQKSPFELKKKGIAECHFLPQHAPVVGYWAKSKSRVLLLEVSRLGRQTSHPAEGVLRALFLLLPLLFLGPDFFLLLPSELLLHSLLLLPPVSRTGRFSSLVLEEEERATAERLIGAGRRLDCRDTLLPSFSARD